MDAVLAACLHVEYSTSPKTSQITTINSFKIAIYRFVGRGGGEIDVSHENYR